MMRRKMMALAAVPVAALLAGGGVAVAQAAGGPSGAAVVQQASVHGPGNPCDGQHARNGQLARVVNVPVRHDSDHGIRDRARDRACDWDHTAQQPGSGARSGVTAPAHHGDDHGVHHGEDGRDG